METVKKPKKIEKDGAVKASKADYMREISSKLKEKIRAQRDYRELFLQRFAKGHELKEMERQMVAFEKSGDPIFIQWSGMPCPIDILKAKFNLELFRYNILCGEENHYVDVLKTMGMSEGAIKKVLEGEYDKDDKKLKKMSLESVEESGIDYCG